MIIHAENLTKTFGAHDAVRGLNLAVPEGAALALIGPNGAGKTTTIRLLMNLIAPDKGRAEVLGVDSRKLSAREFAQIGYVSENQELPTALTVNQFFAYVRSLYPTWDRAVEDDLRRRFDLPADRKLSKLSHGMRLKASLASALAFKPKLLVLDEPLGGLDPLVRDELLEGLLAQAMDTTILISSHELSEIEGMATHVAFIDRGSLLFQESMESLLGRFRDVMVVYKDGGRPPVEVPATWVNPTATSATFSFIDTQFTGEAALKKALADRKVEIERIDIRPMPLREASKALMREIRKGVPA